MIKRIEDVQGILDENRHEIAFIIGNGLNNYLSKEKGIPSLSWKDMLLKLWNLVSIDPIIEFPNGTSFTEFYDILELKNNNNIRIENPLDFQKEVVELIKVWESTVYHERLVGKIRRFQAPLLTTNYDDLFEKSLNLKRYRTVNKGFTDIYPWTTYYGEFIKEDPLVGFGVWHINGIVDYHRSIRLGLSHYMQSVSRVQRLLHKNEEVNDYNGKNQNNWLGMNTWLHIVFNRSLFIVGLALDENETFLRWLLLQRKAYFKKFPEREYRGWYVNKGKIDSGKKFFLNYVGIEVIEMESYEAINEGIWSE